MMPPSQIFGRRLKNSPTDSAGSGPMSRYVMRAPSRPPRKTQMATSWMTSLLMPTFSARRPASQVHSRKAKNSIMPKPYTGMPPGNQPVRMGMRNSTCNMTDSSNGASGADLRARGAGKGTRVGRGNLAPTGAGFVGRGFPASSNPCRRRGLVLSTAPPPFFLRPSGRLQRGVHDVQPPTGAERERSDPALLLQEGEQVAALLLPELTQVVGVV